jgi:hypothetical protein
MSKRGMTNSDQAVQGKVQHTKPCHDCPMRRNAIPGWLGGMTPADYRTLCHSDAPVDCHAIKGTQCAGVAIYRTNVVKRAEFRLPADHEAVFSTPMEFVEWHTDQVASFEKLRQLREQNGGTHEDTQQKTRGHRPRARAAAGADPAR